MFIRTDITFNPWNNLQLDGLEAARVELILPKTMPTIVGVCYRPPTQVNFYDLLEPICCKSNVYFERECIIMCKFSTNLFLPLSSPKESFFFFAKCLVLEQLIIELTRLSINTGLCKIISKI